VKYSDAEPFASSSAGWMCNFCVAQEFELKAFHVLSVTVVMHLINRASKVLC